MRALQGELIPIFVQIGLNKNDQNVLRMNLSIRIADGLKTSHVFYFNFDLARYSFVLMYVPFCATMRA